MPEALALLWTPGGVRLLALPGGETVGALPLPEASPSARNDFALYPGPVLRIPSATREPFVRLGPDGPQTLPRVPGEGELTPPACRAHPGDVFTAIDRDRLWVLSPAHPTWTSRPLPQGVVARDVSRAPDGSLWVAGGVKRNGDRQEAVLVRLAGPEDEIIVPQIPPADRRRVAGRGAEEDYWHLDMEGSPAVAVASCPWFHDGDFTEFALIGWDAGWNVVTMKEGVRFWTRDSGLTLYTPGGERLRVAGHGDRPRASDLRPALRAAWPLNARPSIEPAVRSAAVHGDEILLTASVYDWSRTPPDHIRASAVFHSTDDGGTFRCLLKTTGSES